MNFVRRSGRIAKEIRILLVGTDTSGHFFSEETTTAVLSLHGAGIVSRYRLAADEILMLRLYGTSAEAGVRLVGQIGQETRGYTYGVEFLDPDLDFWELKFPPPMEWTSDTDCALQCTACQNREVVHQSEVEADVYALIQSILRFCQRCGTSTVWRQAVSDDRSPTETSVNSGTLPSELPAPASPVLAGSPLATSYSSETALLLAEKETAVEAPVHGAAQPGMLPHVLTPASLHRAANRRRGLRTGVHFTARIRHAEAGEEITECDDISTGGFSFRSRKSYAVGSVIEAAVPYSLGWDAVFVSGCIRHVEKLVGATLYRYGVAYTKPPKSPREF